MVEVFDIDAPLSFPQEPHPVRLSLEEVEKRKARLDTCPLSIFEHLTELKSFFVEVRFLLCYWLISLVFVWGCVSGGIL